MSERRESLRLFATSAPTTPQKRAGENDDNTQDLILDGKRQRRSTLVGAAPPDAGAADAVQGTGKGILKSPGGPKSPARGVLSDADAVLNAAPDSVRKGVTFDAAKSAGGNDRKSKNFRKSLGRRVSFAQTAHIRCELSMFP